MERIENKAITLPYGAEKKQLLNIARRVVAYKKDFVDNRLKPEVCMHSHELSKYSVLLGRILFSAIFILSSIAHFSANTINYAMNRGVPMAQFFVPLFGVISLLGGLSILLGYRARIGAWLLVIFLIPATFMMHTFWSISDPRAAMIEHIMFMKNLALMGAALLIAHFGSGPLSLSHKHPG